MGRLRLDPEPDGVDGESREDEQEIRLAIHGFRKQSYPRGRVCATRKPVEFRRCRVRRDLGTSGAIEPVPIPDIIEDAGPFAGQFWGTSMNRQGYSMLEVMVALGLASGVGLITASSLHLQSRGTKTKIQRDAFDKMGGDLTFLLENPRTCQLNLEGYIVPNAGATMAVAGVPEVIAHPSIYRPDEHLNEGALVMERGLKSEGMLARRFRLIDEGVARVGTRLLRLEVELDRAADEKSQMKFLGSPVLRKEYLLLAELDHDPTISPYNFISGCVLASVPAVRRPASEIAGNSLSKSDRAAFWANESVKWTDRENQLLEPAVQLFAQQSSAENDSFQRDRASLQTSIAQSAAYLKQLQASGASADMISKAQESLALLENDLKFRELLNRRLNQAFDRVNEAIGDRKKSVADFDRKLQDILLAGFRAGDLSPQAEYLGEKASGRQPADETAGVLSSVNDKRPVWLRTLASLRLQRAHEFQQGVDKVRRAYVPLEEGTRELSQHIQSYEVTSYIDGIRSNTRDAHSIAADVIRRGYQLQQQMSSNPQGAGAAQNSFSVWLKQQEARLTKIESDVTVARLDFEKKLAKFENDRLEAYAEVSSKTLKIRDETDKAVIRVFLQMSSLRREQNLEFGGPTH